MSIENLSDADLRALAQFSAIFGEQAREELARRAGQVEGSAVKVETAARTGGTEAALAGPAFPKGRWTR